MSETPGFFQPFRAVHPLWPLRSKTVDRFELDCSGTKLYRINSMGYRGAEYKADAPSHVYVFGCSYTFGSGLNEEELWYEHFVNSYAALDGTERSVINVLNFGLSGASNSEIARLALVQCDAKKPNLALILFSFQNRYEYAAGRHIFNLGPWSVDADYIDAATRRVAADFYAAYQHEQGALDTIKNMLLTQLYFEKHSVPYVMGVVSPLISIPPVAEPLLNMLCSRRIAWVGEELLKLTAACPETWLDKAADGIHFGPKIQQLIGSIMWRQFELPSP